MANVWDFLDGLATTAGSVLVAKENAAAAAAAAQTDQTVAAPVASVQASVSGDSSTLLWVGVGLAVLIGAFVLLRK